MSGAWQRGRSRLPVKQSPARDTAVRIHPHPPQAGLAQSGRAAASKAEGSRFDPVVRCQSFLGVAKWSKAPACNTGGLNARVRSNRTAESMPR